MRWQVYGVQVYSTLYSLQQIVVIAGTLDSLQQIIVATYIQATDKSVS